MGKVSVIYQIQYSRIDLGLAGDMTSAYRHRLGMCGFTSAAGHSYLSSRHIVGLRDHIKTANKSKDGADLLTFIWGVL